MNWERVIGLEIHAQLATASKIFSPADASFCNTPNAHVREVDWGLPGALPALNRAAVDCAILLGLALDAKVNQVSEFARKNYFYPDLPKGYQISQYEHPVVAGGYLLIDTPDGQKTIGIIRAHLEEDAGKLLHEGLVGGSGVDLNRAGVALLEIVSEPDLTSVSEAVIYAKEMRRLLRWLGVCDGNMQEGSFRIDANISVRRAGETLGTRCEIKNLNSFRFMEKALNYEAERQIALLEDGKAVSQQTRLFDVAGGRTRAMRGKEDAADYRYFPDPDLPPLIISDEWLEKIRARLPELPRARKARFIKNYELSDYDADALTAECALADYYETATSVLSGNAEAAKLCANWLNGDLSALLNKNNISIEESPVSAQQLAGLVRQIIDGVISGKTAKTVLEKMWAGAGDAKDIIAREGLKQISGDDALEAIAAQIIAATPQASGTIPRRQRQTIGIFCRPNDERNQRSSESGAILRNHAA